MDNPKNKMRQHKLQLEYIFFLKMIINTTITYQFIQMIQLYFSRTTMPSINVDLGKDIAKTFSPVMFYNYAQGIKERVIGDVLHISNKITHLCLN